MSAKIPILLTIFLGACCPTHAQSNSDQGFGGLGTGAEGFKKPVRGKFFQFPRDHGVHHKYRIEWWYLTANLTGEDGRSYGAQWTLFRSALKPEQANGWSSPQLWMGHAALTSPDVHHYSERRARGGIGQAGVKLNPFNAWIDDWEMAGKSGTGDALDRLKVKAGGEEFSYELDLSATGPLVAQGDRGYSVKSQSGSASYYYSQPFFQVSGSINLPSGRVGVSGSAWLDREWSSQPLDAQQRGWDWISLHLQTGAKVMGFQLRGKGENVFTSATWINQDGRPEPLPNGALKMKPVTTSNLEGREIPVAWQISLPSKRLNVTIKALNPKSWMGTSIPYWEGPVKISGSHNGQGYLEMTGY